MSETHAATATLELEKPDERDVSNDEANQKERTVDSNWDWELTPLVEADAHVIIKVPWAGGVEMPLGAAMYLIHQTPENVYFVTAMVRQALAEAEMMRTEIFNEELTTDEEEPGEEQAEPHELDQKKNPKEKKNSTQSQAEDKSRKVIKEHKPPEQRNNRPEIAAAETNAKNTTVVPISAVANDTAKGYTAPKNVDTDSLPKELPSVQKKPKDSIQKPVIHRPNQKTTEIQTPAREMIKEKQATKPELKTSQPELIPEVQKKDPTIVRDTATKITPVRPESKENQEAEKFNLPAVIEPSTELETETQLSKQFDVINLANPSEDKDIVYESPIELGNIPEPTAIGYREEINEFNNPQEEELIIDRFEIDATGVDEPNIYKLTATKAEVADPEPEQLALANSTLGEVEDSFSQLVERVNDSQPETAEAINEILDKIIEVPSKLEAEEAKTLISDEEVQKELEELFTELFDTVGIDYSAEVIESLAYLTITWDITDEIEKMKKAKADDVPKDRGTHEIIKKLLAAFSTIKKAIANAGAIGKSALRLYIFSLTS